MRCSVQKPLSRRPQALYAQPTVYFYVEGEIVFAEAL